MRCTQCSQIVKPVAAIDIDGTLGNYHDHFRFFASGYVGRALRSGYDGSTEFDYWLGLEKAMYREAKLAYRQGGLKRTMTVYDGASRLVKTLRASGVEIWIATTRPFLRLDNIDPDTRHWLERNGIEYDGLIYGEDKYAQLTSIVDKERIVAVMDDLPDQFDIAVRAGLPAVMRYNSHNRAVRRDPGVADLHEALLWIKARVEIWREQHG